MTRTHTLCLAALGLGAVSATPAAAAPIPAASAPTLAARAVETVAYGCGPGFIPNRWGECRSMYRRYGYARPYYGPRYGYVGAYAGPGLHVGPYGVGLSFR